MLGFVFHHKNNITTSTFGLKSKENNENDMTLVVWAGTVFGPCLWLLSACRHSLAESTQHKTGIFTFQLAGYFGWVRAF